MANENVVIPWDLKDTSMTLGMCKFIVAEGADGPKLRASKEPFASHESLVYAARKEGIEGKVLGGGTLFINPRNRTIRACERTILYGPAPQGVVERLLADYCSEAGYEKPIVEMDKY
ncbi:MAG TPA: hypothetical protein HA362_02510 [Nanoarchaeota archaeon]|nr:hypothetical protein [Nanoarchaeota archaeon]